MAKRTRTTPLAGPSAPLPENVLPSSTFPADPPASSRNFLDHSSKLKKTKVEKPSEAQAATQNTRLPSTTLVATSPTTITIILHNTDLKLDRSLHKKHGAPVKLASVDSRTSTQKLASASNNTIKASFSRPDITHQCLMMLLDSPLNKSNKLKILMENNDGKVIRVSSAFRVPRTWRVFAKVMADFLSNPRGELCEKLPSAVPTEMLSTSKSCSVSEPFLKVLEPPLKAYLPDSDSCTRISIHSNGVFCRLRDQLPRLLERQHKKAQNLVFFVDVGTSMTPVPPDHTFAPVSELVWTLSHYPIASCVVCNRLCNELEYLLSSVS